MRTFSGDEALLEEDLLVAKGGLGFLLYRNSSLDHESEHSSILEQRRNWH
ncbi:unnamed protein product [Prunus brigantina]